LCVCPSSSWDPSSRQPRTCWACMWPALTEFYKWAKQI
jgi:hypothetical protein